MANGGDGHVCRVREAMLCLFVAALAFTFDPAEAVTPTLTASVTSSYDDNLFRLPKRSLTSLPHTSDIANTVALIGSVQTDSSPVIFSVQGAAERTLFLKNRNLDSTEYDVTGQADYKAASGQVTIDVSRARRASSFEDLRVGPRSIQTLQIAHIEGERSSASGLGLVGSATVSTNRNSNFNSSLADNRRVEVTGGFGYVSPSGNIVALEGRRLIARGLNDRSITIGGLPTVYRADFNETSANLRIEWQRPQLWSVSGRIGYARHRDRSGITSDFRGVIGNGKLSWTPTPFITANLSAARSFSADQTPFANGVKITSIGANLALQPANSFRLTVSYDNRQRVFRYDLQAADPITAARTERLSTVALSGDYTLAARLHATLAIEHRWRQSNIAAAVYKGTGVTLTLSMPLTR